MTDHIDQLSGIFPAVATPFTLDGKVDIANLQKNISIWNTKGIKGYLLLGSTGEVAHLDRGEKLAILEAARNSIPKSMPMIVGTGAFSTQATIAFTRRSAEIGADYALVVTPHYYKRDMTQAVLRSYFEAVADASPIPILLYSVPQFTGMQIVPELVAMLSEHPNIVGIKDSSGDMRTLIKTLSLVQKNFAVLVGSALVLYPSLLVGAHGAILAVANFAPEVCQEIFKTVKKEAEEEEKVMSSSGSSNKVIRLNKLAGQGLGQGARTYQERLLNLTEQIVTNYGIGGIKYAMSCVGYSGGYVRSPLIMPDEQGQQTIRRGLKTSGLFESLSVE